MISGLTYIPDIISENIAHTLLKNIDGEEWRVDFKRRVQHYGYIYDYKRRKVTAEMKLGNLPKWSNGLVKLLLEHSQFGVQADQMIVNEYNSGQGIAHHVDCEPCFGDVIASLSLQSASVMSFIHLETQEKQELVLEPNSLLIMRDEARYNWKHGISARKKDMIDGVIYHRTRRVSVTFRKVILVDG